MPSKVLNKSASKRKQNGRRIVKGQSAKAKQKCELETSPKEQISELEKEILSIKINEFEGKLSRKKHVCSYMEEEISIYNTLYNEKQLVKKESMKLLNNAFEDFSTEIFLLEQELNDMQLNYQQILKEKKFCCSYKDKVRKLILMEEKLDSKLFEVEKFSEEIPALKIKLEILQRNNNIKREKFIEENLEIIAQFELCLRRIEEELDLTVNKIINDSKLKLNLLPVHYKILFLSGMLSSSWLDFALNYLTFLQSQNIELEKTFIELKVCNKSERKNLIKYFSQHGISSVMTLEITHCKGKNLIPLEIRNLKCGDIIIYPKQEYMVILHYQKMQDYQHNKLQYVKSDIEKLESVIKSLELSREVCFTSSYLIQIICKTGSILKKEL